MSIDLEPCPFCGSNPHISLGKKGSCQLHGEPFQSVRIHCDKRECLFKPSIQAGDIFNGGKEKATEEAAKLWNTRAPKQESGEHSSNCAWHADFYKCTCGDV